MSKAEESNKVDDDIPDMIDCMKDDIDRIRDQLEDFELELRNLENPVSNPKDPFSPDTNSVADCIYDARNALDEASFSIDQILKENER